MTARGAGPVSSSVKTFPLRLTNSGWPHSLVFNFLQNGKGGLQDFLVQHEAV